MLIVTDFLVIGSGIAGLSIALKAAEAGTVAIITKKQKAESNTNYAQGGIAAVASPKDSLESHVNDTLIAGADLCHPDAVELLVRSGPQRIQELIQLGVNFTRSQNKRFDLGREGGHSYNRILHVKDYTGQEVEKALLAATKAHPNIQTFENYVAIDLITEHHLANHIKTASTECNCWGAYVLQEDEREIHRFLAKATILATGGCGQVYSHTTNPAIATGDGVAMAFRAGALIANMEFMQFHPTTLFHPQAGSFLISEAVRGAGAILRTQNGEVFMKKYHPQADLAPRDIVARAIDSELKKRGENYVLLDITHLSVPEIQDRFPKIFNNCLKYNLDISADPIPVVPAAHYMCGGVGTNLMGQTTIRGLYACGEAAHTGVHGANRLASNSLLEAVVFAEQINLHSRDFVLTRKELPEVPKWNDEGTFNNEEWVLIAHDKIEIQNLMWDYVGIVRSNLRLERAQRRIRLIAREIEQFYKKAKISAGLLELRNLACVTNMIILSALRRKESRGLHFTTDFPSRNDKQWHQDTLFQLKTGKLRTLSLKSLDPGW
ncbi:MAG: L-aspartate oxidase [Methanosarcinaceae archaeon]